MAEDTPSIEEQYTALSQLMSGSPWKEVFQPNVDALLRSDMVRLAQVNRGDLSDDFLRGRIAVYDWLLNGIANQIRQYHEEKNRPEQADSQPVGHPYGEDNPLEQ